MVHLDYAGITRGPGRRWWRMPLALLLFLYAAAIVLLFGAEFASEWTRLPGDDDEVSSEVRDLWGRARRLVPARR